METPGWLVPFMVGLLFLQALGLVPVIRRMRGSDPETRTRGRLDLLETIGSLLLISGVLLSLTVAEPLFWLAPAGLLLLVVCYAVKCAHWLRDRRHTAG
ncbi:hypothetical protein ACFW2Y_31400 [Streptomyces sp. NPDC058877]|uniref:hypothetical protein n=1 Tax=unclassified Streptomyces TaxID=2593676 RepID=UPI003687AC07